MKDAREIRKRIWKEYLQKAKGSPEKVAKLIYEEDKKQYSKNPEFWE